MNWPEFVYTVLLKPRPLRYLANTMLRKICATRKRFGDTWWVLNPNDPVVSGAATLGLYERSETALFKTLCRPGMTFLDIGANTGYYSAWAMELMKGNGRIIAFEPDPEALGYLEKTRDINGCSFMTVIPAAASDHQGEAKLFRNLSNRGDNRLYANNLCSDEITIQCLSVDAVMRDLGVEVVDLIKIDVQGFEGHVLLGMTDTVKRSPNVTLLMEFWPWGLSEAGTDANEMLKLLENLGFTLFEVMNEGLLRPLNDHVSFIAGLPGRVYANVVGFRNAAK